MIIRKLGIADRKAFFELTDAVVEALANKAFLPPLIQTTSASSYAERWFQVT